MPCAFRLDSDGSHQCQFAVPEGELIEFDGRTWCRFHLPLRADEATSPKADWTQEQIAAFNGEIFAHIDKAKEKRNRTADLSGVVFPGGIQFKHYRGETDSLPEINFSHATFGGLAGFEEVNFGGDASFEEASFLGGTWFGGAKFGGETTFAGVSFGGHATFAGAEFGGDARFGGALFGGNANFEKAKFGGDARFERTNFSGVVTFVGASFCGDAAFWNAKFYGNAWFSKASFDGNAWLQNVTFDGSADFSGAGENAQSNANTFHRVSFADATFGGPARFHNRKFLSTTNFDGAAFEHAPEFHGCTLHQDTTFPPQSHFRDWGGARAALAYRTLKHAMASVHARGEEAKFYALEQKSLRASPDIGRWDRLFSLFYERTADYGQSFMCPLACLLYATFIAFPFFYALLLACYLYFWSKSVYPAIHFEDVTWFSVQQVFQPFEIFRERAAAVETVPEVMRAMPGCLRWLVAFLTTAQSLLTFSLLALFLLALRRRFKLD